MGLAMPWRSVALATRVATAEVVGMAASLSLACLATLAESAGMREQAEEADIAVRAPKEVQLVPLLGLAEKTDGPGLEA
jgi:hypothetical protein